MARLAGPDNSLALASGQIMCSLQLAEAQLTEWHLSDDDRAHPAQGGATPWFTKRQVILHARCALQPSCDDGPANRTVGDGCSATCQLLPPWEIEPNNSIATAAITPGSNTSATRR
jgi:cysteine-rich repeat protein